MPPYKNSWATNAWNFWRRQWCRYPAHDELFQIFHQRCSGLAKCQDNNQNGLWRIIRSRSDFNSTSSEPTTFISKIVSSNDSQTIHETVRSTQEEISLTTPFIILVVLFIFISLLSLLFLFWRRKKAKNFETSLVKKEEIIEDRSLSLESTLLSHNRISEESNESSARPKLSPVTHKDTLILDIEKELIVEPPLDRHPALKFIDVNNPFPPHPGTRVMMPEILSPLPSPVRQERNSKHMSYSPATKAEPSIAISQETILKYSSDDADLSLLSKETSDKDFYSDKPRSEVEKFKSSSILEKGYQSKCEIIKEEFENGSVQEDYIKLKSNSETEAHPWLQLFSKKNGPRSPVFTNMDTNQSVNVSSGDYHKKIAPIIQDKSDQIHLMSDRWSKSTLELTDSPTNVASDCYIPGSWINSTSLDDINIHNSDIKSYHSSDANQNFGPKKFISLDLGPEINSLYPSKVDYLRNNGSENTNNTDNNYDTDDENYNFGSKIDVPVIERSETKIWRRWLKR
ncbi:hypothetical protein HI914_05178 [Erysiphe necator]|nr:hypothetical protein HI914_05178 [Erysiphe necator]